MTPVFGPIDYNAFLAASIHYLRLARPHLFPEIQKVASHMVVLRLWPNGCRIQAVEIAFLDGVAMTSISSRPA